jgi:D-hexose-6-phosphate mutarotase
MESLKIHEIPGRVTVIGGPGGMPVIQVRTDASEAEIHPHGAHVTRFRKNGGAPLLFMSEASEFQPGKPIRGGVPVIFPWFGAREGQPFHGFARVTVWDLQETAALPDASVRLRFRLPEGDGFQADYIVTVGNTLKLELSVTNTSATDLTFESCLHTYFQIGDIHRTEVRGLQGASYLDQLLGERLTEEAGSIRFTAETDRIYQDTAATVDIVDPALGRIIRVRKSGSLSTVVWNPWIAKAQRMPDFGDEEYLQMVCVESGNVREHAITLAPGERATLEVELDTLPLD